ncbi:Abi family protein [Leptotrichia sp. oral taxon 223]|nr:Abi family protein [Leptotrichia sp. oral taxon 223]
MRSNLLKYIFIAESNIKTKLAYYFCEKYKTDNNAYRNENNFNYIPELRRTIDKLVQKLKKTIKKQSNIQGSRINHYTTNYTTIPLWVLIPQLDFGTTAYFFKCSQKDIQSKIAKNMKFEFIKANSKFNNEYIFTGEALSDIIFFINSFRNICAHNERLYDHKFTTNNIDNFIVHEHYRLNFNYGLFDLILVLKFFISPLEYDALITLLANSLGFLHNNVEKNDFIKILNKMKFPRNWEEILEIEEKFQRMKEFYKNQ